MAVPYISSPRRWIEAQSLFRRRSRYFPMTPSKRLAARVLQQEHRIYPEAVRWFMEGRLKISEGAVEISSAAFDSSILYSPGL